MNDVLLLSSWFLGDWLVSWFCAVWKKLFRMFMKIIFFHIEPYCHLVTPVMIAYPNPIYVLIKLNVLTAILLNIISLNLCSNIMIELLDFAYPSYSYSLLFFFVNFCPPCFSLVSPESFFVWDCRSLVQSVKANKLYLHFYSSQCCFNNFEHQSDWTRRLI